MSVMSDGYENALRTIATAYEGEVAAVGGKSLATIATNVLSSGAFFQRLRDGKPFLVHNLERLTAFFREPANWPDGTVPAAAREALISMGRAPVDEFMTQSCVTSAKRVASNNCADSIERTRA